MQYTSVNLTYNSQTGWVETTSLDILYFLYLLSASFIAQRPRREFNSLHEFMVPVAIFGSP